MAHPSSGKNAVSRALLIREFQEVLLQEFQKLEQLKLNGEDGIIEDSTEAETDRKLRKFRLCLTMENFSSGLVQLIKNSPYLEHLEILADGQTSCGLPYHDVFRLWPELKTLVIRGHVSCDQVLQNVDADFCGIHQEELELMRAMEVQELEKFQLVPIGPCVTTMKHLETLSISLLFGDSSLKSGNGPSYGFLSRMTEILVLKRMPWLNFSLNFHQGSIQGIAFHVKSRGGPMNNY